MSAQISKNLLVHSATAYPPEGFDADRNRVYGEAVELGAVYVTSTRGQTNGATGKTPADTMILYFDCVNSTASKEVEFVKNMTIVFQGVKYTVNTVTACYSLGGLHHYELGLV